MAIGIVAVEWRDLFVQFPTFAEALVLRIALDDFYFNWIHGICLFENAVLLFRMYRVRFQVVNMFKFK